MPVGAHRPAISILVLVGALSAAITPAPAEAQPRRADAAVTRHHTARVDGIDIFYREAGVAGAPALLLLHGFPTSSHMFRNLIPALAHRYHVIAPDYPVFGLTRRSSRSVTRTRESEREARELAPTKARPCRPATSNRRPPA